MLSLVDSEPYHVLLYHVSFYQVSLYSTSLYHVSLYPSSLFLMSPFLMSPFLMSLFLMSLYPRYRRTPRLRLVEISSSKITAVLAETMTLDTLTSAGTRTFRVEEVLPCDLPLNDDEIMVPTAHFQKEAFSTFGSPFLLKVQLLIFNLRMTTSSYLRYSDLLLQVRVPLTI